MFEAKAIADQIGFPVMIKAANGGGGKGMREVYHPHKFVSQFQVAQQEAIRAFGDDRMYIEKFIVKPHHIEVQVPGDHFAILLLWSERDCSIQRNHQS